MRSFRIDFKGVEIGLDNKTKLMDSKQKKEGEPKDRQSITMKKIPFQK